MRAILILLLAASVGPAAAQFYLGRILNKTIETTKKFQEANKEFSTDDEIALGNGVTAGVRGATRLHSDQTLQRYVNRIGKWVAMHSDRADLPWSFGVMDTETVNAFAMPGGSVLVSHGLVKRLANEAELAGVLAHEIAHVVMKHQLSAIQSTLNSDVWSSLGKDAAGQAIGRRGGDTFGLKNAAASAGVEAVKSGVFLRPLDRGMEYDADRMGVVLAARSCYDAYGLVAVLSMLAQVKGDGSGAAIFDTHPAASDRIAELEGFMARLGDRLASLPQVEGRFKQVVK